MTSMHHVGVWVMPMAQSKGRLVTPSVRGARPCLVLKLYGHLPESAALPCTSTAQAFGHAAPAEACALFSAQLSHDLLEPRIL